MSDDRYRVQYNAGRCEVYDDSGETKEVVASYEDYEEAVYKAAALNQRTETRHTYIPEESFDESEWDIQSTYYNPDTETEYLDDLRIKCEPERRSVAVVQNKAKRAWHLLPFDVLEELVDVMQEGAQKYEEDDWKHGFPEDRGDYLDKAQRHMSALYQDEETDQETGLPHAIKAMANLMIYRWHERRDECDGDLPSLDPDKVADEVKKAKEYLRECMNEMEGA